MVLGNCPYNSWKRLQSRCGVLNTETKLSEIFLLCFAVGLFAWRYTQASFFSVSLALSSLSLTTNLTSEISRGRDISSSPWDIWSW